MPVTYEQATSADIQELIGLRIAYLTDDFGELPAEQLAMLPGELESYFEQHLGKDLLAFVARDTSIVACAWLLLVPKPPSPRFPRGRTGVLFNVYTKPERRHQGLATGVMRQLMDESRARDLDVLELHATDDGHPLYLSLGFADDTAPHKPMRFVL